MPGLFACLCIRSSGGIFAMLFEGGQFAHYLFNLLGLAAAEIHKFDAGYIAIELADDAEQAQLEALDLKAQFDLIIDLCIHFAFGGYCAASFTHPGQRSAYLGSIGQNHETRTAV